MPETAARRVLLDENVDRQLEPLFGTDLDVLTVRDRGWGGLKNGELLRAAAGEFDVTALIRPPAQLSLAGEQRGSCC